MTLTVILRPLIMLLPKCKPRKSSAQRNKQTRKHHVCVSFSWQGKSFPFCERFHLSVWWQAEGKYRRQKLFIPRTRRAPRSWSISKRLERLSAPVSSGPPANFRRNEANISFLRLALHAAKPTSSYLVDIDQGPGLTNYLTTRKGNLSLLNFSLTLWCPFLSELIKSWASLALLSKHLLLTPWKDNKVKEMQKGHLYELGVFVYSDCNKAHVVLDIRHSPTLWFLWPQHDWHFPFFSKTQIIDNWSGLCLPPKVSKVNRKLVVSPSVSLIHRTAEGAQREKRAHRGMGRNDEMRPSATVLGISTASVLSMPIKTGCGWNLSYFSVWLIRF